MFCSSPGQTYFIALFGGEIRQDLSLSHGEFGIVYSLATLTSAFLLLRTGALIDRLDLKKFSFIIAVGLAVASGLMSISANVFMLFFAVLLLRHFGQGLMTMTSATTMMRYLQAHKAKANSLSSMGYSVSEALLPSLIILMLLSFSWRQSWLIIGFVMLAIVPILLFTLLGDHGSRHHRYLSHMESNFEVNSDQDHQHQWTRSEVLRDPLFYMFIPSVLSQTLLYTGFMFHQIHLVEQKGWSLVVWGSLYALFSFVSIVMSFVVGALVDRVGAVRLAPFVTLPMALGLIVLSSASTVAVAVVFMVSMGVSTGAQGATVTPFLAERYGNKHFGSIKSLGTFAMVLMSAVSPILLGMFIDLGISINTLAQGGALYAVIVSIIAYVAYQLSLADK